MNDEESYYSERDAGDKYEREVRIKKKIGRPKSKEKMKRLSICTEQATVYDFFELCDTLAISRSEGFKCLVRQYIDLRQKFELWPPKQQMSDKEAAEMEVRWARMMERGIDPDVPFIEYRTVKKSESWLECVL